MYLLLKFLHFVCSLSSLIILLVFPVLGTFHQMFYSTFQIFHLKFGGSKWDLPYFDLLHWSLTSKYEADTYMDGRKWEILTTLISHMLNLWYWSRMHRKCGINRKPRASQQKKLKSHIKSEINQISVENKHCRNFLNSSCHLEKMKYCGEHQIYNSRFSIKSVTHAWMPDLYWTMFCFFNTKDG